MFFTPFILESEEFPRAENYIHVSQKLQSSSSAYPLGPSLVTLLTERQADASHSYSDVTVQPGRLFNGRTKSGLGFSAKTVDSSPYAPIEMASYRREQLDAYNTLLQRRKTPRVPFDSVACHLKNCEADEPSNSKKMFQCSLAAAHESDLNSIHSKGITATGMPSANNLTDSKSFKLPNHSSGNGRVRSHPITISIGKINPKFGSSGVKVGYEPSTAWTSLEDTSSDRSKIRQQITNIPSQEFKPKPTLQFWPLRTTYAPRKAEACNNFVRVCIVFHIMTVLKIKACETQL